jgi:inhibitor of cysteine peptidase
VAELTLTEAENGGTFAVHLGDPIVITLPENPSTGYRWSADSLDETVLALDGHDYSPGGPGVGSGGTVAWRLHGKKEGRTRLALKKVRSWEANSAPSAQFAVSLEIKS